jgi:hypothetical protein
MEKFSIQQLKEECVNSLNKEPKDATEREIGYSQALRHIIKLIDEKYSQMHELEIVCAFTMGNEKDYDITHKLGEEYYNYIFKNLSYATRPF